MKNPSDMTAKDISSRFLIEELNLRAVRLNLHQSFLQIIQQHSYPAVIATWLGEALVADTLATGLLKFDGQVVMHIQNKNSPLRLLSCKCNHLQQISGLVQWDSNATDEELAAAALQGELIISIMQHKMQPYQSITTLNGHSITQTISDYFDQSEQLPSKIYFSQSDEENLEGLLLQHLPTSSDSTHKADSEQTRKLFDQLDEKLIINLLNTQPTGAEVITELFPQQDILHQKDDKISFKCSCDRKRMANALINMGNDECDKLLSTNKFISITCEFCGKEENFDEQQVNSLWN
jgi:molecular chaperone Hsp33